MSYIISPQARRRYGLGEDFVAAKSGATLQLTSAMQATAPTYDSAAAAAEAAKQAELRAAMIAAETTVQSKGYKSSKTAAQLTVTSPPIIAPAVTAPAVTAVTQPSTTFVDTAKTVSPTQLTSATAGPAAAMSPYSYLQATGAAAPAPEAPVAPSTPSPSLFESAPAVQTPAAGTPPPASQNMTPTYGEQRPGQQVMVTTIGPDGRPLTYMTSAPQYVPGQAPGGASKALFESSRSSSSAAPRTGGGTTVAGQKADAKRAVQGKDDWFTSPVTGVKYTASEVAQAQSEEGAKPTGNSIIPAVAGLLSWFLLRR